MSLNGVEILGTTDQIQTLVRDKRIDVIVIAHRSSDREKMWQFISTCQETTAQVKVLPGVVELIEGRYQDPLTLRDVSIDDILSRTPTTINAEPCQRILGDKVVLVTGAAGSIGSELCRQILRFKPRLLLALDNDETRLHELTLERNRDGWCPLQLSIADICDPRRIKRTFQQYKPQVVFHAAAYKHVPLLECHPDEAWRVNVMGTVIVSQMAHECEVERFVFISTDKAVNPCCVMGASKRIGELWVKGLAKCSDTTFTTVRFGNVIGSRGSVIPTFARQIERGGPLTVTHPEMSRFFMSIPEAANLVLQAAAYGQSDETFMLEMGEEVSILNLAERMIRLKGLRVHKDIEIRYVGVRPGEKLHEQLVYDQEQRIATPHPSIYQLHSSDEPIDRQILLGAMSILNHALRLNWEEQHMREGIFDIASCDIDAFLDRVMGLDLKHIQGQLTSDTKDGRERAGQGGRSDQHGYIAPGTASALGVPAGLRP
jgi:FlaA1/EpsC-like NDP-sugar epimerase